MSADFPDDSDLIEAVLESRDEFGYPDMVDSIKFLKEREIKVDSLRLLIVFDGVQVRNSRRRMRANERKLRIANRAFVAGVVIYVLAVILGFVSAPGAG